MISISKTKFCKQNSIAIYSQIAVREGQPETRKVIATQCLALGRPVIESHWKDDVIFDEDDDLDSLRRKKK